MRSILALAVLAVLATFTVQDVVRADSSLNCKGLKKWSYDTTYKKGDDVYLSGSSHDTKWECTAATCSKAYPDTVDGLKSWKDLGICADR